MNETCLFINTNYIKYKRNSFYRNCFIHMFSYFNINSSQKLMTCISESHCICTRNIYI